MAAVQVDPEQARIAAAAGLGQVGEAAAVGRPVDGCDRERLGLQHVQLVRAAAVRLDDDRPEAPVARREVPPVGRPDRAPPQRQLLEDALRRNRFNQRATAAALNLSYDQLRHALKRHKLQDSAA